MKKADWLKKKCAPCNGNIPILSGAEVRTHLKGLVGWVLSGDKRSIHTEYLMKDFSAAIRLIGRIAELADREGHHPDIHLTCYRKLTIELSTHAINGLSENDLILAAKIGKLPKKLKILR